MYKQINEHILGLFLGKIREVEHSIGGDILLYYGPIDDALVQPLNDIVTNLNQSDDFDKIKSDEVCDKKLYILLTTNGGSATACERYVSIFRHYYSEVNFVIFDYAYSAGTILTMSGDNIYMNYLSVLGPIDPQVMNKEGHYVPALGYLDKINELLKKAKDGTISDAEFLILRDFDLADIRRYEQAKELTIDLLERWLVKYKFKDWRITETSKQLVTEERKRSKAKEIGEKLSDNNLWKSHGRPIHKDRLIEELNLRINDIAELPCYKELSDLYNLSMDYISKERKKVFIQTRSNGFQF